MATVSQSKWVLQTTTLVVWALAAGSTAYWGLRLSTGRGEVANLPAATAPAAVDSLTVARVLGARAQVAMPQASIASRFVLQGVVAVAPGGGAALIAVDGTIASLEVMDGDPLLVRSALDAVGQWRYRPTLLNGSPVEVETVITVVYTLNQ